MSWVQDTFKTMHRWFQPAKAGGTNAVTQWDVVGEGGGTWQVAIKDGACSVSEGAAVNPDVTMEISARDWLQMLGGRHTAQSLFMAGKLSIRGDISLALKMASVFKPGDRRAEMLPEQAQALLKQRPGGRIGQGARFDPDDLVATARRLTGLHDLGGD